MSTTRPKPTHAELRNLGLVFYVGESKPVGLQLIEIDSKTKKITPMDISAAALVNQAASKVVFVSPQNVRNEKALSYSSDGVDGSVEYLILVADAWVNDKTKTGRWEAYAEIVYNDGQKFLSDSIYFLVEKKTA